MIGSDPGRIGAGKLSPLWAEMAWVEAIRAVIAKNFIVLSKYYYY
jgi:hypothetical protein